MLPPGLRRRRDFAIPMRSYAPASQTNDRAMPFLVRQMSRRRGDGATIY